MASYIRIGHQFINVENADHIEVQQMLNGNISVTVSYRGKETPPHGIYIENDLDSPTLYDDITDAIQEALENLCDCDCENIGDYMEDYEID